MSGALPVNPKNPVVGYEPIVQKLLDHIHSEGWSDLFNEAVTSAHQSGIAEMQSTKTLQDYLTFINSLLRWVPSEDWQGKDIYNYLCKFYFVLDQPSVKRLQSPIKPEDKEQKLTWLLTGWCATPLRWWEIRADSGVTIKNMHWKISELLERSPYKDRFNNGIFMHAFLGPNDYHRQHAPVGGTVLEARVIPGQVYLEVIPKQDNTGFKLHRSFDAPDSAGYQFSQARGLVVLDTQIGLVAVLPIGMAQVSSVILSAEKGITLKKGRRAELFPVWWE